jgi:hypothetical protein
VGKRRAPDRFARLDGLVSFEVFEGIYHGGPIRGVGLRAFNRESGEWEHTWTDNLEPGHFHVWRGRFADGKIDLFAEWIDEGGVSVRSRLTWSDGESRIGRARDSGGERRQVHWVIEFRRRR